MDTEFYKSIFPPFGLRALAVFKGGLKSPPTHYFFEGDEDFIEAAQTYDKLGKNVYHGCAVYATDANRKGDNVQAMKSLWADLDVGPAKAYATKQEAVVQFEAFRLTASLPPPHYVQSGGGVHAYFPFTKPIEPDTWARLAALFAACMDHFGVKHDSSRTQDRASILRIPGTSNYKTDPPKAVKIVRMGEETPASELYEKFKAYASANDITEFDKALPRGNKPLLTNDLIGVKNHPPSEGALVAKNCPVLQEVEETGGDVDYHVWWRAMGVAKHTTTPDETAAHWTRNRGLPRHEQNDWRKMTAEWGYGPTTCTDFSKHSDKCSNCPHLGRLGSPLQLGSSEQPVIEPIVTPTLSLTQTTVPSTWEFGAPWIIDKRGKATRTGIREGKMTLSVQRETGEYESVPFCDRYWQIMRRVRLANKTWGLEIGYQEYPGHPHKTFEIDSAIVMAPDKLKPAFSGQEIHIYEGNRGMSKVQELLRYDQDLQYQWGMETQEMQTMGWINVENHMRGELTGEFVLGDQIFRPHQPRQTVKLADTVDVALREDFRTKGTTKDWVALVDQIYNRPGAEAYQFIIATAFAAPLVRLMPGGGEWHGIPVVIGGETGAAKTSTALVAMSMYAPGQVLRFSAQGGKGGQGDTINALSIKVGSLRSLPFIMDEMTECEATKVADIFYMLSNGKARDRMGPNAKMIPNPYRWDTLSLVTSNESLHEVLTGLRASTSQEATQSRSFQIWLTKEELKTVFKGVDRTLVEDTLLANHFGMVGQEWLQFLVDNLLQIRSMLGRMRAKYQINPEDSSALRFYKDLLITVKCGMQLARRKGFIHWDTSATMKWAEDQLRTLKSEVGARDWEGTVSDFVASMHGRTIVTKRFVTGRGGHRMTTMELPLEPLSTTLPPIARKAIDDRVFAFTENYMRTWCREARIMPSTLLEYMVGNNYLVGAPGKKIEPVRLSLGSGTTVARPRSLCYVMHYNRLVSSSISDEEKDDDDEASNIVQFQQTPADLENGDSVTDLATDSETAASNPT